MVCQLCDAHSIAFAGSASAAKLSLHYRQSASECRYGHNALFSLKETKSTSNAEQPQAAPVCLKQPTHHPLSNTITFVLIHEHESTYAAIIKRSAFVCV